MEREWDLERINREQERVKQSTSGWKLSDYVLQPELEEEEEIALEDLPQFDPKWMEKDPIIQECLRQKREEEARLLASNPQTSEPEKKDKDPFLSILEHIWGTLIGDWNNNSDPLQDLTNMGAGLIPIVDQVLDVRDLAAHLYYMIFQRDYENPMRWLALGLTAVGAIPAVGSVIKGLGKIAIFQDGAKAIAKNAEPLLEGIKRINPEWGDIGKLRAVINSNWDDGVATSKELWLGVLGRINQGVDSIPTPPGWIWGGTPLTIYKNQVQNIIGKINKLSNTKLDEALGVIKREVDEVLNELDRIIRGVEPQLVGEGVGNVNPSRIDADGVRRNEPLRIEGNNSDGIPAHTSNRLGNPPRQEIKSITRKYKPDSESEARAIWHVLQQSSTKEVIAGENDIKRFFDINRKEKGVNMVDILKIEKSGKLVPVEVKNMKRIDLYDEKNAAFKKFEAISKRVDMSQIDHFEVICHPNSILPPNIRVDKQGKVSQMVSGVQPPQWEIVTFGGKPVYVKYGDLGEISK